MSVQAFAVTAAAASFLIAIVFTVRKVLNAWFNLFIAAVGFQILAFSTPLETIQEALSAKPVMFFAVNLLILLIFPFLFMSVRAARGERIRARDWPYCAVFTLSVVILCLESAGWDFDGFVSGLIGARLVGPAGGYMGTARSIWQDIHHCVFSLSGLVLAFRAPGVVRGKSAPLEIRILRGTSAYTLLILAASIVLEWIGPRLDLLVTSIMLTATVFAFILFLIIRSPALVRDSKRKYEGSKMTPGESEIIMERITRLMKEEEAYKDPDFDLPTAARRIGTSVPFLSRAVNQSGGNFARMLNMYRVREAKRLLAETAAPVTDVAFEAGFGSLSSFNAIFKSECGLSPSEYREKRG
jgi:AraC-like DNA-binding protein